MGESKRKQAAGVRGPGQITRENDDWTERLFDLAEANSAASHAKGTIPGIFVEQLFNEHELVVFVWTVGTRNFTYAAKGWRHYYAYAQSNVPPAVPTTALVVPNEQVARAFAGIFGDGGPGGEDAISPTLAAEAKARMRRIPALDVSVRH